MDAIEFLREKDGFTLRVRPPGIGQQKMVVVPALVLVGIAAWLTSVGFQGFESKGRPGDPMQLFYSIPFWAGGAAFFAIGIQRAFRTVMFFGNAQVFTIDIAGPLHKTTRQFPRASLEAAAAGESGTQVGGRQLRQLQLYFSGQNAPYCLLTGQDDDELFKIAGHLTETLLPGARAHSREHFMEVRNAPIHAQLFQILCGAGAVVGLTGFALQGIIGKPAAGILFFATVVAVLVTFFTVARRCQCPRCGASIERDGLSPEGYLRYTCSACRVVWQSPVRAGGPRNR